MDDTTKQKLEALTPIFANATIGDFSQDVKIPEDDDVVTSVYVGIQLMIDVIREKIAQVELELQEVQSTDRAKTEFVGMASHQMRSPLTTINWYTELLLRQNTDNLTPDQKKYIEELYKSSKRMVTLSNDLLTVSTLELNTFIPKMQEFDLKEFADSIVLKYEADAAKRSIQVKKEYGENMPFITTGGQFVKLILQNLLSNAVNYTPDGKYVTFKLTYDMATEHFTIVVTDTGYGIPQDQQEKIFSKFFRASNIREKVSDADGLGLHIVKLILDRVGGTISFTSKENEGTSFQVILPKKAILKT